MYQAIYKCRCCGKELDNGKTYPSIKHNPELIDGIFLWHECKQNYLGACDFQGFRKVGD